MARAVPTLDAAIDEADGDGAEEEEIPDAPWMKSDADLDRERMEQAMRDAATRRARWGATTGMG